MSASDRYLAPIRKQIIELVEDGSRVIEFGSGSGQLLAELAPKISAGLGIDQSETKISKALRLRDAQLLNNINFLNLELDDNFQSEERYDYAIASLFFHTLPEELAISLVQKMCAISSKVIICGFSNPATPLQRALVWLDQRFTSHYPYFKRYQRQGFLVGLLQKTGVANYQELDTFDATLKIYCWHQ